MNSKCPLCPNKPHKTWRPFCSKRCQEIDLGRWLLGTYRVSTEETLESDHSDDHEV